MAEPITHLISELRRRLPAPVSMCKDAIVAADGDLSRAHDIVVRNLTNTVVVRTGATADDASAKLVAAHFDVERAVELWYRENPPPDPPPREKLRRGIELVASIRIASPEMQRYGHIIPRPDTRFELRLITHHERFTESAYALDYDCALEDSRTRVTRIFTEGVQATLDQLSAWGVTEDMLQTPDAFDSCLVNSPIDSYLLPGKLPHLWVDDEIDAS